MSLASWRRIFSSLIPAGMLLLLSGCGGRVALPAFPGAEGEAAYVSGGRGGDVYHVTNLDDSGPGSLRGGLETAKGPRTIVFDVGGIIPLRSTLTVGKDHITIAGQTAPGMGICIVNYGVEVEGENIIIRHIRVRPGDACKGNQEEKGFWRDAMNLSGTDILVDHCSASWAVDENISAVGRTHSRNIITIQYCINAECLHHTNIYHGEDKDVPGHSMGSLLKPFKGDGAMSVHHNLYVSNNNRNPAVGTYHADQSLNVDIRNNVIYNCRQNGYSSGDSRRVNMDYVGNYVIAGPATGEKYLQRAFSANAKNHVFIHQAGNRIDGNRNGVRDGVDTGWAMFAGQYTKSPEPLTGSTVTTQSAEEAYRRVLAEAGAMPWNRDAVDTRIVEGVIKETGKIINSQTEVGGYPQIPTVYRPKNFDTDGDGMPDAWEQSHGLNPNVPDNNGDVNGDGYTNLEEYLCSIPGTETPVTCPSCGIKALHYHRQFRWVECRRRSAGRFRSGDRAKVLLQVGIAVAVDVPVVVRDVGIPAV